MPYREGLIIDGAELIIRSIMATEPNHWFRIKFDEDNDRTEIYTANGTMRIETLGGLLELIATTLRSGGPLTIQTPSGNTLTLEPGDGTLTINADVVSGVYKRVVESYAGLVDYTTVHAAITPDGAAHSDVTQPDAARNMTLLISNTATTAQTPSGGDVVITGTSWDGVTSISETLTVPATSIAGLGSSTVTGSLAFLSISSITFYTETNTNITVEVRSGDLLGLANQITAVADVYKAVVNGSQVTPTVNATNNTVDVGGIAAGANITVWYRALLRKWS